ncbi:hypothetical protein KI387_016201, partial [Taxus chinensis]
MLRLTLCKPKFTRLEEIQVQQFNRYCSQFKSKVKAVTMAPPLRSEEAAHSTPPVLISKRNCSKNGPVNSKPINCRRSLYKDLKNLHGSNSTAAIIIDGEEKEVKGSKEWCVYLIISADMRKTYVGVTTNFKRRLRQHNGELNGGAKASRAGRPWQSVCLVHGFKDRSE